MGLLRRNRAFVWLIGAALVATGVSGAYFMQFRQIGQDRTDRLTTFTELEILTLRAMALSDLTRERVVALDLVYREGSTAYEPSASRKLSVQDLNEQLLVVADAGGPLAQSAATFDQDLQALADPADAVLSDARRFDSYLDFDDLLRCVPIDRADGTVDDRVRLLDEVLWELTFDASRFELIVGGSGRTTHGATDSVASWLNYDIEMAEDAPAPFAGAEIEPRAVATDDEAIRSGLDAVGQLETEELVQRAQRWVHDGGPIRNMEPPASLASIATAAERTVETSSSWLGSVIAAEIASVEAELDQLNGARVRSLVLTLAGLAVAFVACVVVLRRLRNARAATLAVRRESARQLRFLANVSHEIRSLLTAIAGFVEMLRSERDSLSEAEISEYLEIVSVQTRQLSSLVEDVLTVSRLEADQLTLDLADVGLRSAVQAVVDIAFSELD